MHACSGELFEAREGIEIVGISTDSRSVPRGGLFVALAGERFDGHEFVASARDRGALPLVARGRSIGGARIEVDDPLAALGAIANAWLERRRAAGPLPILAIGGAAGKTSTKTLAAAAASALFGETLVTPGNLNNRIGVPMTLLTLRTDHRAAIVECGTSEPGEIAALGEILSPDVGLVINVGIEHSERLGTLAEIADEECALLQASRRAAVTSSDDPLLTLHLSRVETARKITFGVAPEAIFRLVGREVLPEGGSIVRWTGPGVEETSVRTRLAGAAAATNLIAALAGVLTLLERSASSQELEAVMSALSGVEPVPGRMRLLRLGELWILDDSYNSNPKSVTASLEAARELAEIRRARLLVALGDMLELGELAASEHDAMIRAADASGAARLLLIGPESTAAAGRMPCATPVSLFPDAEAAAAEVTRFVAPGDLLLVKGSRSIGTERLVRALGAGGGSGSPADL